MNKILKTIILGAFAISTMSCDDYFDVDQKGNVPEEIFYSSLNNLRLGLNGVYNVFQSANYQKSELIFGEAMSDDSWNAQDTEINEMGQLLNFQFTTDNSYILTRYQVNYNIINKCNKIIRSIPEVKYRANGTSEKEIREVYGQAKFLRAVCYFNLVKTFGGVSIMPENQDIANLVVPRSSLTETYAYIEKELRESLMLLFKGRYQQAAVGQVGIGGGLGMLLKVLTYEASDGVKIDVDKKEKWNEAAEIGRYFIDGKDIKVKDLLKLESTDDASWKELSDRLFLDQSIKPETVMAGQDVVSIHRLIDNFEKLYRVEGEYCAESLFEINHYDFSGSGVSSDEGWPLTNCITDNSGSTDIAVTPTSDLKDQFVNDPRLIFTMSDRSINDYYKQETSSPDIKYFSYGNSLIFTKYYVFPSEGKPAARNYRVMRYAEALLLYAEVCNEIGENTKAIDLVNMVRQRARKLLDSSNSVAKYNAAISSSNFTDYAYVPSDMAKEYILKEKRIELAGEFDRWYEICRLGIVANRMSFIGKNPPIEPSGAQRVRGKYFRKGVNEIFPIPQKEVLISNGVITQNFGY